MEADTNCRHFAYDVFKCILLNETAWMSLKMSLKLVTRVRINSIPALVQIMACADQATNHYLNQWWLVYWRIDASLGLGELSLADAASNRLNLNFTPFSLSAIMPHIMFDISDLHLEMVNVWDIVSAFIRPLGCFCSDIFFLKHGYFFLKHGPVAMDLLLY